MRIGTFNLENLDDSSDRRGEAPPLAERLPLLRPQLERMQADIVCLQEVNAQRQAGGRHKQREFRALARLLEGTRYSSYHLAHSLTRDGVGPLDVQNLVVLSRLPVVACRQYWHDLVPPPLARRVTADPEEPEATEIAWDRPVLHVTVALPSGRPLHVLNMHLRAPLAAAIPGQKVGPFVWRTSSGWAEGYYLASVKRGGQALEARLAVERLFDAERDALVMVCGDMNAEVTEVPLRILCAEEEDTGNGRLAVRQLIPLERTVPDSQRFSVVHAGRHLLLDHLLASRALLGALRQVEIHNEALSDEVIGYATMDRPPDSFHAPIVAEFALDG